MDSSASGSPRLVFAQRLTALFEAAGNPTLRSVAATAEQRMRLARGTGRGGSVSVQRISDWRKGRNVPAQFDTLTPILLTLIELAKKRSVADPELLNLQAWRLLWKTADAWRPELEAANAVCPYRGLTSYQQADAAWFFGRRTATDELAALVRGTPDGTGGIVALVGASGAGKSSLIHAGLVPAIATSADEYTVISMVPGAAPRQALAAALSNQEPGAEKDAWPDDRRGLLVVDQFEELFTACREDRERTEFLKSLAEIASNNRVGVLLAVRADFYARCLHYPVLEDALKNRCYVLGPMRRQELTDAITGPARAAELKLEDGLAELVITELCGLDNTDDQQSYDPGALPLLSHVMAATWQHREGIRLTIAGYRKAGGVIGSVAATAEHAWDELTVSQQIEARQLMLALVSVGSDGRDARRRAIGTELLGRAVDSAAAEIALETLVRARLVTSDADSVYFTHEIVLRAWPRLRSWIDEDRVGYLVRQRLEADAADWTAAERDPALLYRGNRLATAQDAIGERDGGGPVAEFLTAAAASKTRSRRWAAATRIGLALLGVIVLVLAIATYAQTRLTAQERDNATLAAILAEADSVRSTDPSLSAQLELVAANYSPGDPEVRSRLLRTQNLPLAAVLDGHSNEVAQVAYQPGGRMLASASRDRTVRLWRTEDRGNPHPLGAALDCAEPATSLAFSTGGSVLWAACGPQIRGWRVDDPEHPKPLPPMVSDSGTVTMIATTPDRGTLAAAGPDGAVTLWNITDPGAPVRIGTPLPISGTTRALALQPNGAWLAVATDTAVQLWTMADPAAAAPLGQPITVPRTIQSLAVSPDGNTLAVGSGQEDVYAATNVGDATLTLWNVADPAQPNLYGAPLVIASRSALPALAFDLDGNTLATAVRDRVTIWNIADRAHPLRLGEPLLAPAERCSGTWAFQPCKDRPKSVAFSADGHTLTVGGDRGPIRLWSLPPAVIAGRLGWAVLAPNFSAGGTMVTGMLGGRVELWDMRDRNSVRQLADLGPGPRAEPIFSPGLSRDGRLVAAATAGSPVVQLLDVSDLTKIRTVTEVPDAVLGWFYTNGRMLTVRNTMPWTYQIWDVSDPTHPVRSSEPVVFATAKEFSMLLNAGLDGRVVGTFGADTTPGGGQEPVLRLWDLSNPAVPREAARIPNDPARPVTWFGLSPDSRTLVSLAADTMQIWDISNLDHIRSIGDPINAHTSNIQSVEFSPDGRLMATASADTVRLWDLSDRARPQPIGHSITMPSTTSWNLAFDPGGRYLIGTGEGAMSMWDLDVDDAERRICEVTRTVLTPEVWQSRLPKLPYRPPCD